jgi:hypothetical protein
LKAKDENSRNRIRIHLSEAWIRASKCAQLAFKLSRRYIEEVLEGWTRDLYGEEQKQDQSEQLIAELAAAEADWRQARQDLQDMLLHRRTADC